jgi:hypothetical protein
MRTMTPPELIADTGDRLDCIFEVTVNALTASADHATQQAVAAGKPASFPAAKIDEGAPFRAQTEQGEGCERLTFMRTTLEHEPPKDGFPEFIIFKQRDQCMLVETHGMTELTPVKADKSNAEAYARQVDIVAKALQAYQGRIGARTPHEMGISGYDRHRNPPNYHRAIVAGVALGLVLAVGISRGPAMVSDIRGSEGEAQPPAAAPNASPAHANPAKLHFRNLVRAGSSTYQIVEYDARFSPAELAALTQAPTASMNTQLPDGMTHAHHLTNVDAQWKDGSDCTSADIPDGPYDLAEVITTDPKDAKVGDSLKAYFTGNQLRICKQAGVTVAPEYLDNIYVEFTKQ